MYSQRLADHLSVDRYGDFLLTEAIRPALHVPVVPRQGYRLGRFRHPDSGWSIPMLAAAVSREQLFEVFYALVEQLDETVDVILETSHDSINSEHRDLCRHCIDRPVLLSYLCEFEKLLLNDGCTGVAVIGGQGTTEVQFDEHKLLVVYARDLAPFEGVFRAAGIPRNDRLKLISEGDHLHSTEPDFWNQFEQLCQRIGVSQPVQSVNW